MKKRYLYSQVLKDLKRKMVFIGGPRQIGKTTLAQSLPSKKLYLNWDFDEHRERILTRQLDTSPLWIFDEIHKFKTWRNFLKGLYDIHKKQHQFLITGSARLDLFRRGGDSLQGRYHYLRLHPLSFSEIKGQTKKDILSLYEYGGFPEPFFSQNKIEAQRWTRDYRFRFLKDDIFSIERVHDLGQLELLFLRLPQLVGSPLSINSLREDLRVSFKAVQHWLDIFESFYGIFRLPPFGTVKIKAVQKEQKHYHFDWNLVQDHGARFENMMACHLLKWIHFKQDTEAENLELRYFRTTDRKEVDFIITDNQKPIMAIETKIEDTPLDLNLLYFKKKFPSVQAYQVSLKGKKDYVSAEDIRVLPAETFLKKFI